VTKASKLIRNQILLY